MEKLKGYIALIVLMLPLVLCQGQQRSAGSDTLCHDTFGVDLFTGVFSGFGTTRGYTGVAPRMVHRVDDRLTLKAGFAVVSEMFPLMSAPAERNLAPRRQPSRAAAGAVQAEYQVKDNLWLSATAFYVGGQVSPLWRPTGHPLDISAYGGSIAARFRTPRDNYIGIDFNFVHDNTGALGPLLWNPYCYGYDTYFHHAGIGGTWGRGLLGF